MDRAYPNLGLKGDWDLGEDNWKDDMDGNLLMLSVLCQGTFIDFAAVDPGAPAEGDVYVFTAAHPTQPNVVAAYDEAAWHYFAPHAGWKLWNTTVGGYCTFDGANWTVDVLALTTEQIEDMIAGFLTNGGNVVFTYNDAGNLLSIAATQPALYYNYGSNAALNIQSSEVLMDHIVTQAHTLADDFVGCVASVGTNPAALWTASVQKNNVAVGTLAISAAGVVTFNTTGTTVAMAVGDVLSLIAPAGVDAAIQRLRFSFKGLI
jgi:hypothetical protein